VWQAFADNFYLFRGTPSGMWLAHEVNVVFGIQDKLDGQNAQAIYDEIADKLARPEYRPRALFERFNIEVLCTTDAASDPLKHHQAIMDSGWQGVVRPTFRPDAVVNLLAPGWKGAVQALGGAANCDITTYTALIRALESRRAYFKSMGCKATDHGVESAYTARLSDAEAEAIFARALRGEATPEDAKRFTGHMLMEMARMSVEDGMTMQLHVGVYRNHNAQLFEKFGADKGADIPIKTEFVHNLRPLLTEYGNDRRLTLILFGMDESVYSSELAPLAGHYPALKLGPPWWFQDSPNGMARYFDQVMETAGLHNTAGFNDDTRAFVSIPARHDVWRRASANWLAGLVVRGLIDEGEAAEMAPEMANGLARRAYNL
jgi:glucuronate isomerase